jgi:uncharacterized caspase-like protein
LLWYEERRLQVFEAPYQNSFAVIAAIDDYDRLKDAEARGPTGYPPLTNMVPYAKRLKQALIQLGFPEGNVITLFDEQATSDNLENALGEFWIGGSFENADRVILYFGGHGDHVDGNGFLVTYDFVSERPTRTSFLMSDFVGRQFPGITADHLLVAIDACSAGLAVPGAQTLGRWDRLRRQRFATLAQIRADRSEKARNMLVAGTDEEPAVAADGGGIFTLALISGLSGDADWLTDGVIQFNELAAHVDREVTSWAAGLGVQQNPEAFVATQFGRGKVLFLTSDIGGEIAP